MLRGREGAGAAVFARAGGHTSLSPVYRGYLSHCRVSIRRFTESTTKIIAENNGRAPAMSKRNTEENASFFSKLTYSWFSRVVSLGYRKPLERDDLFELNESDSPYIVCPSFEMQWRKEVQKSAPGLMALTLANSS